MGGATLIRELPKAVPIIYRGGILTTYGEREPRVISLEEYMNLEGKRELIEENTTKLEKNKDYERTLRDDKPVRIPRLPGSFFKIGLSDQGKNFDHSKFNGRYGVYQFLCESEDKRFLQEIFEVNDPRTACEEHGYWIYERRLKLEELARQVKRA